MSESEQPARTMPTHDVTVEDVRQLMGASTPHFALQLRNRIRALIRDLPADAAPRVEGEREIARLERIALSGEVRGHDEEELPPLASLGPASDGEVG